MSLPRRTSSSASRRSADSGDTAGFTTKEVALQISAKLDTYIQAQETRRAAEQEATNRAYSDPTYTAAGRQLLSSIASVKEDLTDHEREAQTWRERDQSASARQFAELGASVSSHERTIQRLVGAMALIVFLGGGAFILAAIAFIARIAGVDPV